MSAPVTGLERQGAHLEEPIGDPADGGDDDERPALHTTLDDLADLADLVRAADGRAAELQDDQRAIPFCSGSSESAIRVPRSVQSSPLSQYLR